MQVVHPLRRVDGLGISIPSYPTEMEKTMTNLNLPMPGEEFDGGVVIASVWRNDDDTDGYPISALLLLLDENPDFYRVQHITQVDGNLGLSWLAEPDGSYQFPNIVPAVASYQENGGDY